MVSSNRCSVVNSLFGPKSYLFGHQYAIYYRTVCAFPYPALPDLSLRPSSPVLGLEHEGGGVSPHGQGGAFPRAESCCAARRAEKVVYLENREAQGSFPGEVTGH